MSFCHKSMSRRPSLMTRNCSADCGPSSKKKKKKKKERNRYRLSIIARVCDYDLVTN